MARIIPVNYRDEILPEYQETPVGLLLEYHNLGRAIGSVSAPQVLIGMCMDSRKSLRIPNDFAFVLRTAGANMRDNEFRISYAIAVGGVRTIVLIAHTDCGMARLSQRRDQFIRGLMEVAGWDEARAVRHFEDSAPKFGIRDEVEFVLREAERLRTIYPRIAIAPLLYRVEDDLLYQLRPDAEVISGRVTEPGESDSELHDAATDRAGAR
jgi:carbonic anhydrase